MKEIEKALLAQNHQLQNLELASSNLRNGIDYANLKEKDISMELNKTEEELRGIFQLLNKTKVVHSSIENLVSNENTDLSIAELDYINQLEIQPLKIKQIEIIDWSHFQSNLDNYIKEFEIDLDKDPIQQMLSNEQISKNSQEFDEQFGHVAWNKFDYIFVSITAVVAFIIDVAIVKMPAFDSKYSSKIASNKPLTFLDIPKEKQSQLGQWLNETMSRLLSPENNEMIRNLEKWAKTPYDAVGGAKSFEAIFGSNENVRVSGPTHRVLTPGHDPIMQFIFGVLDCMKGTMSVFGSDGNLNVLDNPKHAEMNIVQAFSKTIAHFITDLGTRQGVPAPLFTVTQAITFDTHIPFNDRGTIRPMQLNELALRMYSRGGYNFNHFLVMGMVPTLIEVMIRTYYYLGGQNQTISTNKDVKLQSMLTIAHTLAMSGNIMKMGMNNWNPLAFNYAELLALSKSLFSTMRAASLSNKGIQNDLLENWNEIQKAL